MKKIVLLLVCFFMSINAFSRGHGGGGHVHVSGYHRHDGTYVQSHYRTSPDGTTTNNWSHAGNVNPYTGKVGTNTSLGRNDGRCCYSSVSYSTSQPALGNNYAQPQYELHNNKTGADYIR